ncbi:hypothetical protein BAE44_0001571 [Dichanthelium oligosanthes]|uniref:Transcription repressor n=1 Tax=Dichanthelium oligosanthes TaxID=888268 RepID=A0A1E5WJ36_9POAL|nr:hypothetical protein BAE44_0001571 [Dichanthelium oligosanthes]
MEEEDAVAKSTNRHARLHRSFLHLSKALKKLHARRGHQQQANASGEPPTPSSSATAASFLSGCMHHPRTHSFAAARRHRHKDESALAVNFGSLRIGPTAAVAGDDGGSSSAQDYYSSDDGGNEEREGVAPVSPPPPALAADKAAVCGAGVAVVTFSAAPYEDFRRSMREMVDDATGPGAGAGAGGGAGGAVPAVDWDFMEELLFCYLRLNDRAVHKDILRAFTDTVAALRRRRRRAAAAKSRRTRRQSRRGDGADSGDDDGAEEAVAAPW